MGRTILITGGSGAIGSLLVERFLAVGDRVYVTTGRQQSLVQFTERLQADPDRLSGIACDLSDPASIHAVVDAVTHQTAGKVVLVNNARTRRTLRVDEQGVVKRSDFLREYLLDVVVPYELSIALSAAVGPRLESVVNIGSQYGTVAGNPSLYDPQDQPGFVHYNVAKAALHHLTRELAVRLAPQETRVNAVAYGGLEGRVDEAFTRRYAHLAPSGRMLNADDIPGPVVFLCSDAASGVNGHVLAVDGGWTIW